MSNQVYEPVIRIETGDAQKTVKSLKKDISDLKDVILNLEEGTDDYAAAVKKLQDDQRQLDKVMGLTKKSATALEGSYDALQHQMSLLRKEWKATNDEARRNELSEQINELNNQLKEFDASTGNFQRNVGNYTSALDALDDKTVSFKESMSQMNDTIEPTKAKFEAVQKISSGVASGFAAVQGAAALLGKDTKNLEEVFIKVQSAMAIAQGVGGLGDLVEGLGKAKVAFEGLGDKIKAVSKAMGATGWLAVIGAVVTAIALLVTHIKNARKEAEGFKVSLEEQEELIKNTSKTSGDLIAQFRIFQIEYSKLNSNKAKLEWIEENASSFNSLGLAINTVNDADKLFIQQSEGVIAMLRARAQAEALTAKYKDEVVKSEEAKAKLQKQDASTGVIYTNNGQLPKQYKDLGLTDSDFSYEWSGGQSGAGVLRPVTEAALKYFDEKFQADYEASIAEIDEAVLYWENRMVEATQGALDLVKKYSGTTQTSGTTTPTIPTLSTDIEVADEPIGKLDTKVQMQEEGEVLKKVKASMLAIEQTYAGDVIGIEERKLARLKELHQEALNVGDYESQLALQQAIADQEVEIERTKVEKKKRLTQEGLATAQYALDVTSGILGEIAAMYEDDEKNAEKNAGKIKALRIAEATINTINGAIGAYTQASATIPPPAGQIIGSVQAAAVTAMGVANIVKMSRTKVGDSSSSGGGGVTPSVSTYSSELPVNYTRNLTSASEVEQLNRDQRIYVLESDITNAQKKASVRSAESSF